MKTLFLFTLALSAISSVSYAAPMQVCGPLSVKANQDNPGVNMQNALARVFSVTDASGQGTFNLMTTDIASAQLVNQLSGQNTLVLVSGTVSATGAKVLKVKSVEAVRACHHN